jgi:hypothetical protein
VGLSVAPTGDDKAIPTKLGDTKLKQLSAQPAMHAVSSAVFCVSLLGALWRWSQSAIVCETEISIAVIAPDAKPVAAGSVATARATKTATMVRPIRMNPLYPSDPSNGESANSKPMWQPIGR